MDQELRAYLDDLRASMEERFTQQDQKIEITARQTQILVEALESKVDLVYEGVGAANEKLTAFQASTASRFEEVQSSFPPYFRDVNGRLERLEKDVPALKRRVTALETRASRRAGKKPPTQ